jgi:signal transduction histidine kinase
VVAVIFQPLRERFQRGVNRLMYGERDEPYVVLSRLSRRLEATLAPDTVLPTVVQTVREALKLPYAAITLSQNGAFVVVAESGTRKLNPRRIPLHYQGEPVGELLLSARPGEQAFGEADLRLLDDLARQAGIAAHGVRLTADLQRSRERLVTAREEERRRLRRDLHDGLGPQLASQTLTIDAAMRLMKDDPQAAAGLLQDLKAQSQAAVADIRRLVYGLRPPALDDLGLPGALQALADTYRHTRPEISITISQSMASLPAAVEVACYRIVQEALTNVVRHANARHCEISLSIAGAMVHLKIRDDGRGMPFDYGGGVGLHSMRERASELGGSFLIESSPDAGTRITARISCTMEE